MHEDAEFYGPSFRHRAALEEELEFFGKKKKKVGFVFEAREVSYGLTSSYLVLIVN